VLLTVHGAKVPLRIQESIADELLEAGSAEADEKLSRILNSTIGLCERQ
jgi:hypothetical protein